MSPTATPRPTAADPAPASTSTSPSGFGWRMASRTIALARPLAGRRWFPLWGVLHHRGRSSGTPYAVPVVMRGRGDAIVIPLPWGRRTNWVRNVLAAGECTVRWRGATRRMGHPRLIGKAEARPAFGWFLRPLVSWMTVTDFLELRPVQA